MVRKIIFIVSIFLIFMTTNAFAGAIELPQTGQMKCYDSAGVEINCAGTGQDGEIRAGMYKYIDFYTVL